MVKTILNTFRIINADVRKAAEEIDDGSIDLIFTSPPYYAQRNYHVDGQLGHEKTSQEYVDQMVDIFWNYYYQKLKPHGLLMLNLGDSYNASGGQGGQGSSKQGVLSKNDKDYKPRDLMSVPWRVYEGLRQAGYYLRSVVVWNKPNGMPESVSGVQWVRHKIRVKPADENEFKKLISEHGKPRHRALTERKKADKQRSGEYSSTATGFNDRWQGNVEPNWIYCPGCDLCSAHKGYVLRWGSGRPSSTYELVGILTKERYYWDTEAVRTKYADATLERSKYPVNKIGGYEAVRLPRIDDETKVKAEAQYSGANLRNVWTIPTHGSSVEHFAMFPEALPETGIKAGTSEKGCCSLCGAPYARVLEFAGKDQMGVYSRTADVNGYSETSALRGNGVNHYTTVDWFPTCNCDSETIVPAVVLDTFNGSGTTGIVANRLRRNYIGVEIGQKYAEISERRIRGDAPLLYPTWNSEEYND